MDTEEPGAASVAAPGLAIQDVTPMALFPPITAAEMLGGKLEWRKVRRLNGREHAGSAPRLDGTQLATHLASAASFALPVGALSLSLSLAAARRLQFRRTA
jgi:hypothetical protein